MGTAKQYFSSNQWRVILTLLGITALGVAIDWDSKYFASSRMSETDPGFIFHDRAGSVLAIPALLAVVLFTAVVVALIRNRLELWSVGAVVVWAGHIGNSISSSLSEGAPDFIPLNTQRVGVIPIIVHNNPHNLTLINVADCLQFVGTWLVLLGVMVVVVKMGWRKFGPNRNCLWTKLSVKDEIRCHGGMGETAEWTSAR